MLGLGNGRVHRRKQGRGSKLQLTAELHGSIEKLAHSKADEAAVKKYQVVIEQRILQPLARLGPAACPNRVDGGGFELRTQLVGKIGVSSGQENLRPQFLVRSDQLRDPLV